ncbi:MAG: hypothetical protein IH586_16775 [Anaerolineaceae bacterium]|nr:hypothetical protein [Anaerolineaceae bacterium]
MVAISYPSIPIGNYESQNASILPTPHHTRPNDLDSFNELILAHQDAVYRQAYMQGKYQLLQGSQGTAAWSNL